VKGGNIMKATILTGGLQAQVENPFKQYGNAMATDYMEFEANNPPRPLVAPLPDRVGEVIEVKPIFQRKENDYWLECNESFYNEVNDEYVRLAYELIEVETEKPCKRCDGAQFLENKVTGDTCPCWECTKPFKYPTTPSSNKAIESVEEAAGRHFLSEAEKSFNPEYIKINGGIENIVDKGKHAWYIKGAEFGANWQKAQRNKEVIATIEAEINSSERLRRRAGYNEALNWVLSTLNQK